MSHEEEGHDLDRRKESLCSNDAWVGVLWGVLSRSLFFALSALFSPGEERRVRVCGVRNRGERRFFEPRGVAVELFFFERGGGGLGEDIHRGRSVKGEFMKKENMGMCTFRCAWGKSVREE